MIVCVEITGATFCLLLMRQWGWTMAISAAIITGQTLLAASSTDCLLTELHWEGIIYNQWPVYSVQLAKINAV